MQSTWTTATGFTQSVRLAVTSPGRSCDPRWFERVVADHARLAVLARQPESGVARQGGRDRERPAHPALQFVPDVDWNRHVDGDRDAADDEHGWGVMDGRDLGGGVASFALSIDAGLEPDPGFQGGVHHHLRKVHFAVVDFEVELEPERRREEAGFAAACRIDLPISPGLLRLPVPLPVCDEVPVGRCQVGVLMRLVVSRRNLRDAFATFLTKLRQV